jgi:hypothetical protein
MSALSPLIEKLKTYPLAIACGVLVWPSQP